MRQDYGSIENATSVKDLRVAVYMCHVRVCVCVYVYVSVCVFFEIMKIVRRFYKRKIDQR